MSEPIQKIGEHSEDVPKKTYEIIHDTALELKCEVYPDWSIDELLCHLPEAALLCLLVRRKLRPMLIDASEYVICKQLLNGRKRGDESPE